MWEGGTHTDIPLTTQTNKTNPHHNSDTTLQSAAPTSSPPHTSAPINIQYHTQAIGRSNANYIDGDNAEMMFHLADVAGEKHNVLLRNDSTCVTTIGYEDPTALQTTQRREAAPFDGRRIQCPRVTLRRGQWRPRHSNGTGNPRRYNKRMTAHGHLCFRCGHREAAPEDRQATNEHIDSHSNEGNLIKPYACKSFPECIHAFNPGYQS